MSPAFQEVGNKAYAWVQDKSSWGWSNAGLVFSGDTAFAIDSLFTVAQTREMLDAYRKQGADELDVLVVTHHHGDHAYGAHVMGAGAILAHERCQTEMLRAGQPDEEVLSQRFPGFDFAGAQYPSADVVFDSQLVYRFGDGDVVVRHLGPAHTIGDCIVYAERQGVLYAGDLLFNGSTPVCMEGSIGGWVRALDEMLLFDPHAFVPGHGPVCGRMEVQACRKYLMRVVEEGTQFFEEGKTVEEAVDGFQLEEFETWANPGRIVANMSRLYAELQGKEPIEDIGLDDIRSRMATFDEKHGSLDTTSLPRSRK